MIDFKHMIRDHSIRILFTEGSDIRMMKAAYRLHHDNLLQPLLYGNRAELHDLAQQFHIDLDGIEIVDPDEFADKEAMILRILLLRKGKTNREEAQAWLNKDTYFCTMYVEMGYADGMLGGSRNSTADTLRPIMQLIKTSPGNTHISSSFLMIKEEKCLLFSDCSLTIKPNVDQLVDITLQTAKTAGMFGIEPCVALLSYSTKGSGAGEDVDLVREAANRLKNMSTNFPVDGEMQVDCALNETVAKLKAKDSSVGGKANVLIFPDLNSGNIGYKLVSNLGGYEALGPILQGARLPMNDLSRSATTEEIYKMALITALQKQNM